MVCHLLLYGMVSAVIYHTIANAIPYNYHTIALVHVQGNNYHGSSLPFYIEVQAGARR